MMKIKLKVINELSSHFSSLQQSYMYTSHSLNIESFMDTLKLDFRGLTLNHEIYTTSLFLK